MERMCWTFPLDRPVPAQLPANKRERRTPLVKCSFDLFTLWFLNGLTKCNITYE